MEIYYHHQCLTFVSLNSSLLLPSCRLILQEIHYFSFRIIQHFIDGFTLSIILFIFLYIPFRNDFSQCHSFRFNQIIVVPRHKAE